MLGSGCVLAAWVAAFLALAAAAPAPGAASPHATHQTQDHGDDEEVRRLCAEMALPGPEARQKRAAAVAALLGMKSVKAQTALHGVLVAPSDPDGVAGLVLGQLVQRLHNPRDPVLGDTGKDDVKARRAAWVAPLARLCGEGVPAANGRAGPARECLLALASWERIPAFRELLAAPDSEARRTAARAAGLCQDLSLARVLGDRLDDPDASVQAAVGAALVRLTFRSEGFASKAEFDAWFEQVAATPKSFVDLAEDAALRAGAEVAAERARSAGAVQEVVLELIESWVHQPEIRWKKIQARVLGHEQLVQACLDRLRQALAGLDRLTGPDADRLALHEALWARLDRAASPEESALLLEVCAYLVAPADEKQHAATVARLLAALAQGSPAVLQRAALSGLRRHESEPTLHAVVEAGLAALEARDADLLPAVLGTLHARGWAAPSVDGAARAEWVRLLGGVVRQRSLPLELRREALSVLDLRDAQQKRVPEAFEVLLGVVEDAAEDPSLRELALIQMQPLVVEPARAERYLPLLVACLQDAAAEIRGRAASLLQGVPEAGKERVLELLAVVRARLLDEADATVHAALGESVRRLADRGDAWPVLPLLSEAARALAQRAPEQVETFRRKAIADGLRVLACQPERPAELWVPAAEALLALGDRSGVRAIFARQDEAKARPEGELLQRVQLLRVRVAQLATGEGSWDDAAHQGEARSVLDAVAELEQRNALPAEPQIVLLRMDIHGDLGQHDQVLALGQALAAAPGLEEGLRKRLLLRLGRSHLAKGQPAPARDALLGLTRGGAVEPEVLDGLESVGAMFVGQALFQDAEAVFAQLVKLTPESSPFFAARLLQHAQAWAQIDPKATALLDMLESRRGVFARDDVPSQLRQQYEALVERVRAAGRG